MTPPCHDATHPDHSSDLSRLNRVSGQLEGVKKMIAERRYCPDILTQLRAMRAAMHAIEANILERHMDGCVQDAMTGDSDTAAKKIAELKDIYKRFGE